MKQCVVFTGMLLHSLANNICDLHACYTCLKFIGIIIHLGYRKIPRYRLAWSLKNLCYDPFISQTMSHHRFEGLLSSLHVVDRQTQLTLKAAGDK